VTASHGFPDDCIVSIRAGGTRRQAALDVLRGHPLTFPLSSVSSEPLKIDVLQRLGSARLILQGHGHGNCKGYHVDLGKEPGAMSLDFSVQDAGTAGTTGTRGTTNTSCTSPEAPEAPKDKAQAPEAPPAQARRFQDAAASAREYLEHHGILSYFQSLLHLVIHARPKEPFQFMMQQLASSQPRLPQASGEADGPGVQVPHDKSVAQMEATLPADASRAHLDGSMKELTRAIEMEHAARAALDRELGLDKGTISGGDTPAQDTVTKELEALRSSLACNAAEFVKRLSAARRGLESHVREQLKEAERAVQEAEHAELREAEQVLISDQTEMRNEVHWSLSAPRQVCPGDTFRVQLWASPRKEQGALGMKSRQAELRGPGGFPEWTVELELPDGLEVEPFSQPSVIQVHQRRSVHFECRCVNTPLATRECRALARSHGNVVELPFSIEVESLGQLAARVASAIRAEYPYDVLPKLDNLLELVQNSERAYSQALRQAWARDGQAVQRLLEIESQELVEDEEGCWRLSASRRGVKRSPRQSAKTVDALIADAKLAQQQLRAALAPGNWVMEERRRNGLQQGKGKGLETGVLVCSDGKMLSDGPLDLACRAFDPGLKNRASVEQAAHHLNGDCSKVLDVARVMLLFDEPGDLCAGINAFEKAFKCVKLENRFREPTTLGWMDVTLLLELPLPHGVHIAEVQMWLSDLNQVRESQEVEGQRSRHSLAAMRTLLESCGVVPEDVANVIALFLRVLRKRRGSESQSPPEMRDVWLAMSEVLDSEVPLQLGAQDICQMRARMRQLLEVVCDWGRPSNSEDSEDREVDREVRLWVRRLLEEACKMGCLAEVLQLLSDGPTLRRLQAEPSLKIEKLSEEISVVDQDHQMLRSSVDELMEQIRAMKGMHQDLLQRCPRNAPTHFVGPPVMPDQPVVAP